jgi:nicotinamidase-related amidase
MALLLIDFINPLDFAGAGKLRKPALRAATVAAALKRRAKAARIPCIYVNDNFGDWSASFAQIVEAMGAKNEAAEKLVELLAPEAGDLSILKPRHSAFYGTPLGFLLEELAVNRLILTGLTTDNCVFATAQDAFVRKFELWIPANCVAAEAGSGEAQVLRHMQRTLKADITSFSGRIRSM